MRHIWPEETVFNRIILKPEERSCSTCGCFTHVCDHRHRRFFSLGGPVHLTCKLTRCSDPQCPGRHHTNSPEAEVFIAPPEWLIGWDVFAWLGHRRFARHWSIPEIQQELAEGYQIEIGTSSIDRYIMRYQTILAARHQDPQYLRSLYQGTEDVILCIDGLQPEKGHETLYAVRELRSKRVWFAESLLSSSHAEMVLLLEQAKNFAEVLGKPVSAWISDKQDAFVSGIAEVFPGVPHRYCENHFVRNLARPTLEADSHAKVQMRSRVRGLRKLERQALEQKRERLEQGVVEEPCPQSQQTAVAAPCITVEQGCSNHSTLGSEASGTEGPEDVVLDYCAAVRGILNDNQGGPLDPPGLRMAAALEQVRQSIERNLEVKKGATWPVV